jgi:hypothetical protein
MVRKILRIGKFKKGFKGLVGWNPIVSWACKRRKEILAGGMETLDMWEKINV